MILYRLWLPRIVVNDCAKITWIILRDGGIIKKVLIAVVWPQSSWVNLLTFFSDSIHLLIATTEDPERSLRAVIASMMILMVAILICLDKDSYFGCDVNVYLQNFLFMKKQKAKHKGMWRPFEAPIKNPRIFILIGLRRWHPLVAIWHERWRGLKRDYSIGRIILSVWDLFHDFLMMMSLSSSSSSTTQRC